MQDPQEKKVEAAETGRNWKRPVSYFLLLSGALCTFLSHNLSQLLQIDVSFVQFGALFLILVGAVLFFSVRETANRTSAYSDFFRRDKDSDSPK